MADKFLVERAQEEKRDLTEDEIAELRLYQSVSEVWTYPPTWEAILDRSLMVSRKGGKPLKTTHVEVASDSWRGRAAFCFEVNQTIFTCTASGPDPPGPCASIGEKCRGKVWVMLEAEVPTALQWGRTRTLYTVWPDIATDAAKNTLKGILQEQHCGGGFPDSQESGVIHDFYVPEVCTIEVRVSNALTGWQKVKVPFTVKSIALLKEGCHPLNLPCLNTEGFDLEGMLSFDEDNESAA